MVKYSAVMIIINNYKSLKEHLRSFLQTQDHNEAFDVTFVTFVSILQL